MTLKANAAKRPVKHLKQSYPQLKALLVEDALYANGAQIEQVLEAGYHYLIAVKPDSHKALFKQAHSRGQSNHYHFKEKEFTNQFYWENNLPLCSSQSDIRVNFLHYQQRDQQGNLVKEFTWITRLVLHKGNVLLVARAGGSRWTMEPGGKHCHRR
jgi:hypothetical protein